MSQNEITPDGMISAMQIGAKFGASGGNVVPGAEVLFGAAVGQLTYMMMNADYSSDRKHGQDFTCQWTG